LAATLIPAMPAPITTISLYCIFFVEG